MRQILSHRGLRLVFMANLVSMLGSGMNAAAVIWHMLQLTHSEVSLGKLLVLQTVPALVLLPFSGVIIDREDRRHLIMLLDFGRGAVILAVALLALAGRVQLWHLYLMNTLVAAGFWLFWPTINALIQELTPEGDFVGTNTLLLGSVQSGWLIAGSLVGFLYDRIGLGWILMIDFATYAISFLCYLMVRRGRVIVKPPPAHAGAVAREGWEKFWHELREGMIYVKTRPRIILVGTSWALFIAAMLTQGVVSAPLSDRIMHAGAMGYGWFNAGWGLGAFSSVLYSPALIRLWKARPAAGISLGLLALCLVALPFSKWLWIAVALYILMGAGRGVGGTALGSEMMEIVPKHFMGRVQNTFYFAGTLLQLGLSLLVAAVAHRVSLTLGFAIIGIGYAVGCLSAVWPAPKLAESAVETEPQLTTSD